MSKSITAEVEERIMLEIAKLTEGEKDSALAHVSEFGRFSKQMVDCRTDAVGVRVQRQADIAQKMAQESLRLIINPLRAAIRRGARVPPRKCYQLTD